MSTYLPFPHKATLLFFVSLLFTCHQAHAEVEVLTHYPACDYEILKTAKKKRPVRFSNQKATQKEWSIASNILIEGLEKEAIEIGAEAILLIDKSIKQPEIRKNTKIVQRDFMLSLTAQLIKNCDPEPDRQPIPTGFGKDGSRGVTINLGKIGGWEKQLTIEIKDDNKIIAPDIGQYLVSTNQVFGLGLGTSSELVKDKLGSPSFELALSDDHYLISYGRSLFMIFQQDKLVSASNSSPLFSYDFKSLLRFDERVDDLNFVIESTVHEGEIAADNLVSAGWHLQNDMAVKSSNGNLLKLTFDEFLEGDSGALSQRITGFTLSAAHYKQEKLAVAQNKSLYLNLSEWLQNRDEFGELSIAPLKSYVIGKGLVSQNEQIYLFDNHLVVETSGKSVTKVRFLESTFDETWINAKEDWLFGQLEQHMSLADAKSILGDEVTDIDGELQIYGDNDSTTLWFDHQGDVMRLYAAEISIY